MNVRSAILLTNGTDREEGGMFLKIIKLFLGDLLLVEDESRA